MLISLHVLWVVVVLLLKDDISLPYLDMLSERPHLKQKKWRGSYRRQFSIVLSVGSLQSKVLLSELIQNFCKI